jgi:pimeloyl-ACP methyl ester carboxylesterase
MCWKRGRRGRGISLPGKSRGSRGWGGLATVKKSFLPGASGILNDLAAMSHYRTLSLADWEQALKRTITSLTVAVALLSFGTVTSISQEQPFVVGSTAVFDFMRFASTDANPLVFNKIRDVERRIPRFVFVPGVLGSKISVRNPGERDFRDVWGGTSDLVPGDLRVYDGQEVRTEALHDISFIWQNVDIYGEGLSQLAVLAISDPGLLSQFSYDWRGDNVDSARQLQDWLCDRRDQFDAREIVIVAHSMGGLVTNYWHHHFSKSCADGKPITWNLKEVIFLGTPLFGAPRAIEAFAEGPQLLAARDGTIFGAVLGLADRATIARSLNDNAASFLSSYQLIPVYGESCARLDPPPPAPLFNRVVGNTAQPVGTLFNAEAWRTWNWPATIPDHIRESFYDSFLPDALERAHSFLCDVANYDISREVPATYFYGQSEHPDTPVAYEMELRGDRVGLVFPCQALGDECMVGGDGTVPEFVARNKWRSSASRSRQTETRHAELLKSRQFIFYIKNLIDEASIRAAADIFSDPDLFETANIYAMKTASIFPHDGKVGLSDDIVDFNSDVLEQVGVDSKYFETMAINSGTYREISEWSKAAYFVSRPGSEQSFNNANLAAIASLGEEDFDGAKVLLDSAIYSGELIGLPPRDLAAIYTQSGDAWQAVGDNAVAVRNWSSASVLGSIEAKLRLQTLEAAMEK